MFRRLTTTIITLTLLLPSLTIAAPKRRAVPKPPPVLTAQEQWCQYFGRVTGAIAHDRDNQVPLTVTIGRLRTILGTALPATTPDMAGLTQTFVAMSIALYSRPDVTPAQARHTFEVGCLTPEGPATGGWTGGGLWR